MVERRTFIKRSSVLAGTAGLIGLSGCLGDDDTDDGDDDDVAPGDDDDATQIPDTIRIGHASPAMAVYKFAIWPAVERALEEAGHTLETDHYGGHVPVAGGLVSEEIVTGYLSVTAIAEARLQGMPLVAVHDNQVEYFFGMVAQPEIDSMQELEGGEIAIHAPVGASAAIANYMIREELGSVDAVDYSYIIGSGARAAALEGGEVDASVVLISVANQLEAEGNGNILARPWDYDGLSGLATNSWAVLEPEIDDRSDEIQLIVDELQNAYDWLYEEDPGTIVDEALASADYPEYDREVWIESLETAREAGLWPREKADALDTERIDNTVDLLVDLDLIDEEVTDVDSSDIVDRRFLD